MRIGQSQTGGDGDPRWERFNPNLPREAQAICDFLKRSAFQLNDIELVGFAESVRLKAENITDAIRKRDQEQARDEIIDRVVEQLTDPAPLKVYELVEWVSEPRLRSAREINDLLMRLGYQTPEGKGWVPTEKATGLAERRLTSNKNPAIDWNRAIVARLRDEAGVKFKIPFMSADYEGFDLDVLLDQAKVAGRALPTKEAIREVGRKCIPDLRFPRLFLDL